VDAADGKDVWSWRPDAGVKSCKPQGLQDDGDYKPGTPGRSRHKP